MRKTWLGLAALLVGGNAAQAQQFQGNPAGYPMAPPNAPYGVPYGMPYGYPGVAPAQYPPPGAVPYYPVGGGMPARPYVPTGMPMPPMAPVQAPLPASPTVPMAEMAPGALADDTFVFHRSHDEKFWVKGDFIFARITAGPLPAALLTTGSVNDPHPGSLDPADTGTAILFGAKSLDFGMLGGVRIQTGFFFDTGNCYSVDLGGTILSPTNIRYIAGSDANGSPLLARPIVNAISGNERSFLTSNPGSLAGSTSIDSRSDFWGLELNVRKHGYWYEHLHAEGLGGFRTLGLRENIRIQDNLRDINGNYLTYNGVPLNAGDRLYEQDLFQTANQFYGFQLGGALTFERDWFSLSLISKVAAGITDQQTIINGLASLTSPGLGNSTSPGGILAQLSNMGDRHNYVFGFVPEIGANMGINLHKNIRFNTGYTFLMWNNVLRPGDLIDRTVNPGLPPGSPDFGASGPARPAYVSRESTFYLHTFNFGLEFRF